MRHRVLIVVMAIGLYLVAGGAARLATTRAVTPQVPPPRVALLAGARGMVSDLIWLHLYGRFGAGDPTGVLSDVELLLALRPESDATRDFLAHWVAFGMVKAEPNPARRLAWWVRGIELWLEGLDARPNSVVLHYGLGEALWIRRDQVDLRERTEALLGETIARGARRHLEAALGEAPMAVGPALFVLAVESWDDPAEAAELLGRCKDALSRMPRDWPGAGEGQVGLREAVNRYLELARIEGSLARLGPDDPERSEIEHRRQVLRAWVEGAENPFVLPRTDPH